MKRTDSKITNINLFWVGFRAIFYHKTRTLFTVLATAIGVGILVFLTSLGFGLRKLVVSQIASLHSLKTADITRGEKNNLDIGNLEEIKKIEGVKSVEPLIMTIGKIDFRGSSFESIVFGATSNYLKLSDIICIAGNFYDSDEKELNFNKKEINETKKEKEKDQGFNNRHFKGIIREKVYFNIKEGEWAIVRKEPTIESPILGYVKRQNIILEGKEILGGRYFSEENFGAFTRSAVNNQVLGKWILAEVPIWEKGGDGKFYPVIENNSHKKVLGYIGENFLEIKENSKLVLLDKSSESQNIDLGHEEEMSNDFLKNLSCEILVNEAIISRLGPSEGNKILGKEVNLSINISTSSNKAKEIKIEKCKIVGIFSGYDSNQIYIPFNILYSLGFKNFSQIKIEVGKENELNNVRKIIEEKGYQTESITDTIKEVDKFFFWFNIGLIFIGIISLLIAIFGMFNTFTVSLLERTREIGIMKALGMKHKEARLLFIFEALIMGLIGGILGILSGLFLGFFVTVIVNIFMVPKGFVFLIYLPWYFPLLIILFTVFISLITVIYPARRAQRISPLDAIRYE